MNCLITGQKKLRLYYVHLTISEFKIGQIISSAAWVWNEFHWLSWQVQFFELGYCGHPQYPYSNIFPNQASDLIISYFKEEYYSFIKDALRNEKIQLVLLYYVYKPKTNASRTKNTNDDEQAYNFFPLYGGESTGFHNHMISVVVFYYSETLESMSVDYVAT